MRGVYLLLISVAVLLLASPARAFTVTLGGATATDGSGLTSAYAQQPGFTVVNFGAEDCSALGTSIVAGVPYTQSGISYTGNGNRACGSLLSNYAAPAGDKTVYLTVPDTALGRTGMVNASVSANLGPLNYFGLYWGSVDRYNSLTLSSGGSVVATVSFDWTVDGMPRNRYVNVQLDSGQTYDSVQLISNGVAFESDNHVFGYVEVPEPASPMLLGSGLLALAALRRRRAPASPEPRA